MYGMEVGSKAMNKKNEKNKAFTKKKKKKKKVVDNT